MRFEYHGLDLLSGGSPSREEIAALLGYARETMGYVPPSYEFLLRNLPGTFKRKLMMVRTADFEFGRRHPAVNYLAALHYYAVIGYEHGILYEMRQARKAGACKGDVLDILSISYLHGHAVGMNAAASSAGGYLAEWDLEPRAEAVFPAEWSSDTSVLSSGLNFATADLEAAEAALLEQWYLRHFGEVPGHVSVMLSYQPSLLKAYRNAFENSIQFGLPVQMLAYVWLYLHSLRHSRDGVREAALLAADLGMARDQVLNACTRAMASVGGSTALTVVQAAAGDVLDRLR